MRINLWLEEEQTCSYTDQWPSVPRLGDQVTLWPRRRTSGSLPAPKVCWVIAVRWNAPEDDPAYVDVILAPHP